MRQDLPRADRLQRAAARADLIPRLARQAGEALGKTAPSEISPEICQLAVYQARASAEFYRASFLKAAEGESDALKKRMGESGGRAAAALDELAAFLEGLAKKASGTPRLGALYAERFRVVTGIQEPYAPEAETLYSPLDRVAHLKKQMENIARTVVDIRVHTRDMPREEVLRYVREEALQDEQFASNMWTRAMTSSPQLTFYHLGYRQVMSLYEDVRAARGASFDLRSFMDGMMEMGPVPVAHYRQRMLR